MDISGKTVLVTGGANGIGRALVECLVTQNARIGILDIDETALEKIKTEYPGLFTYHCDITDDHQVAEAISAFAKECSPVNILVNIAGLVRDSPLITISGEVKRHDIHLWNTILTANLTSVFIVTSHVVEQMVRCRTKGLIINVSSISSQGNAGQSAYAAAKAGVIALTKTWAKELNGLGIRVACISPGFTRTDALKAAMNEKLISEWTRKNPLKRMAAPSEIADGILFIIMNDYFNGKTLELDGGLQL